MDHRARFSTLSASYDDFLFAPVWEDANGMRVTVLSALARMNVDPWEEATRLAAMPKATAEKTLLSILDLVSGRIWTPPEAAAISARLVRLLPQPGQAAAGTANAATGTAIAATGTAKVSAQRTNYWWVWLGFWLVMSFMMPHHQATTPNAGAVTSESARSIPLDSGDADQVRGRQRQGGIKFIVQGGEKHEVTGHSFVAEASYATALNRDSTRVVSCNTTSIVRTLTALKRAGLLRRARGTLLRRATDPWESHLGGIMNTLVPEPEIPSHQGPDAQSVDPDLDVITMAVKVP